MMQVARVYLDTETTGLDPEYHSVVEVGAVAVSEDGTELGCYQSLANPGDWAMKNSDPKAFEVHGIDPDEVRAARPIERVAAEFSEWLREHVGTLHAFPVKFDRDFLSRSPWHIEAGWKECVMKAAQDIMAKKKALPIYYGKPKWPSLAEATSFFEVKMDRAHRALDDARTASRIHGEILVQRELDIANDEARHMIKDGM